MSMLLNDFLFNWAPTANVLDYFIQADFLATMYIVWYIHIGQNGGNIILFVEDAHLGIFSKAKTISLIF